MSHIICYLLIEQESSLSVWESDVCITIIRDNDVIQTCCDVSTCVSTPRYRVGSEPVVVDSRL